MDPTAPPVPSPIEVARRLAALTGLVALVPASLGWVLRPAAFWRGYLFAWLLWASVTLGCALTALVGRGLHRDRAILAVLTAGRRTAPLVVVLAVPLLLHGSESWAWLATASIRQPLALATRFVLVGPAIAGLALAMAALAALSRQEPQVLMPSAKRTLRFSLAFVLAVDAACGWPRMVLASIEIGAVTALALLQRPRCLAWLAVLAFAAHAALLHGLLPEPAMLPSDGQWMPYALDLLLAAALGGLWLALFLWRLDRQPPAPLRPAVDPPAGA